MSAGQAKRASAEVIRSKWMRQVMADPELNLSELKVVIVIGEHLNRESGQAWPGIRRIAGIACLHPRTVIRAVEWLTDRGHMRKERKRKGRHNLANRYTPILRRAATVGNIGESMSLGSGTATPPC